MAVYFMQPVGGGPVKIGHSANVDSRRQQLEARYGQPLVILAVIEGGRKEEHEMHTRFSHLRIEETEQFRPGRELMEFIGEPLLGSRVAESVEVMPSRTLTTAIVLKGKKEWRDWLHGYAKHKGMSACVAIDDALASHAAELGFEPPPCRTKDE